MKNNENLLGNFKLCNYRPQRSCVKIMFLHVSAILSTGECLADSPLGRHPQADTPLGRPLGRHPQADTPPTDTPLGRHAPPPVTATAADGTHPTGMHSCYIYEDL